MRIRLSNGACLRMENGKTAVVYCGQYGSTQRYAEWIARRCGAVLIPFEQASIDDLKSFGTVIYGGAVYAGKIMGIPFIKSNLDFFRKIRLVVYTVGLTQPGDEEAFAQVLDRNFTPEERAGIRFFHFPGALDYSRMNGVQRLMMRVLKKSIEKKGKEQRSRFEESIVQSFGGKVDFTDPSYIDPLVNYITSADGADASK